MAYCSKHSNHYYLGCIKCAEEETQKKKEENSVPDLSNHPCVKCGKEGNCDEKCPDDSGEVYKSTSYNCNACAETENATAPCILEIPECLGKPDVSICPVSGDKTDWCEVPEEEIK